MKNLKSKSPLNIFGWVGLIAGVVLFITGILIRQFSPGTIADTRIIEGFGILLAGWGIIPVIRGISARKNPAAAHRSHLDESDERATALRNQAAFIALLFNVASTSIMLLIYSGLTRGQPGFDPIWFAMAFLVIAPMLIFAGTFAWLNRS